MGDTSIQWTDKTWSPLRVRVRADAGAIAQVKGYTSLVQIATKMEGHVGPHCERVSHGCDNCYSDTNNGRCLPSNGTGFPFDRRSRDLVEPFVDERILLQPLSWRKPQRVFVENQSDLFGEWVPDEDIDRVLAVMALCPQHTFQILTKRPERMLAYIGGDYSGRNGNGAYPEDHARRRVERIAPSSVYEHAREAGYENRKWPLPNVQLGVSCEDQATADARSAILRQIPAALRFISQEPQLENIDWLPEQLVGISWLIQGGESGPGARQFDLKWGAATREACQSANVRYFFKQAGAKVINTEYAHWGHLMRIGDGNHEYNKYIRVRLKDRKGGDMAEWPEDLRVREFPDA